MRIGCTSELCGIPAFTRRLCLTFLSITVLTFWSVRQLAVHYIRCLFIPLPLIVWISFPLPTLGNAALMYIRSMPAMWPSFQAACGLLTMLAAVSIANHLFLLPSWLLVSCPLPSASSASSSATTVWTTIPMQRSREMKSYTLSFM